MMMHDATDDELQGPGLKGKVCQGEFFMRQMVLINVQCICSRVVTMLATNVIGSCMCLLDCFGFEDFGHENVWLDVDVLGTLGYTLE